MPIKVESRMEDLAGHNIRATHEILVDLERAKSVLESLIHDMPDMCCLVTTAGNVIWGNRSTADLLKADPEGLYRERLDTLFTETNWQVFLEKLREAEENGRAVGFELSPDKLGETREYFWNIKTFNAISRRRGSIFVVVGRDVTHLLSERSAKVRLEGELETAKIVQAAFLPKDSFDLGTMEIVSYFEPAERCSGDWWGHFSLGESLELVCIADAMGHGASAALVTAMAHSCSMTMSSILKSHKGDRFCQPSILLAQLNQLMCDTLKGRVSMTFFAALFDIERGRLIFSNAGHNFPVYLPTDPEDERFPRPARVDAKGRRKPSAPPTLAAASNPLGVFRDNVFEDKEIPLKVGDRLILYTDGIIECTNVAQIAWNKRNFIKTITDHAEGGGANLVGHIVGAAKAHFGTEPLKDDITMVMAEVKKLHVPPGSVDKLLGPT